MNEIVRECVLEALMNKFDVAQEGDVALEAETLRKEPGGVWAVQATLYIDVEDV